VGAPAGRRLPPSRVSAPFAAGESGEPAVKVPDDRGNELLVAKPLAEAV